MTHFLVRMLPHGEVLKRLNTLRHLHESTISSPLLKRVQKVCNIRKLFDKYTSHTNTHTMLSFSIEHLKHSFESVHVQCDTLRCFSSKFQPQSSAPSPTLIALARIFERRLLRSGNSSLIPRTFIQKSPTRLRGHPSPFSNFSHLKASTASNQMQNVESSDQTRRWGVKMFHVKKQGVTRGGCLVVEPS